MKTVYMGANVYNDIERTMVSEEDVTTFRAARMRVRPFHASACPTSRSVWPCSGHRVTPGGGLVGLVELCPIADGTGH